MKIDNLITIAEACKMLGISRPTFYVLKEAHKLEPYKSYGSTRLYQRKDIERVKRKCDTK